MAKQIPVLLVTGFLGAGKTTFLNWLIHTHPDLKISLILNEFGDIKLESQFIKEHAGGEIAELANGCMCCVAKSDIPRVVKYILENSPKTDYILIEASGLSDPDPILESLQSQELSSFIRLDTILCIVDALNFAKTSQEHSIVLSQIGDADIVILSKGEEAGDTVTSEVKERIKRLGIGIHVLEFTKDLDPRLFLDPTLPSKKRSAPEDDHDHNHVHETVIEYWYTTDKKVDIDKLSMVMRSLPRDIIRAKGFINAGDKKYLLQYVGSKYTIEEAKWGLLEKRTTAILFLGTVIDTTLMQKMLDTVFA